MCRCVERLRYLFQTRSTATPTIALTTTSYWTMPTISCARTRSAPKTSAARRVRHLPNTRYEMSAKGQSIRSCLVHEFISSHAPRSQRYAHEKKSNGLVSRRNIEVFHSLVKLMFLVSLHQTISIFVSDKVYCDSYDCPDNYKLVDDADDVM